MTSNYEQNLYKRKPSKGKPPMKKPTEHLSQQYRLDRRPKPPCDKTPAVIQITKEYEGGNFPGCICNREKLYVSCLNLHCDWTAPAARESKKCGWHSDIMYLYDLMCCPRCRGPVKEYPKRLPGYEYSDNEDDDL